MFQEDTMHLFSFNINPDSNIPVPVKPWGKCFLKEIIMSDPVHVHQPAATSWDFTIPFDKFTKKTT